VNLQGMIKGWIEGIPFFKEGGSGILLIPASLAYGSNDYNGIPAGSVLIFEIKLISVEYSAANDAEIVKYIADNQLTATKTESGLYYVIDEPGTGKQPTATSNVTVAYKGYYTNKTVFDQGSTTGISLNLQQVIKGWTEGIPYFKEGGSGKLLIPATLGYGSYKYSTIPGGSVLVFDVKLISVN
jgi:FKBP-type peptidyl-prolyl cis-trans isomerase FkpA